MPKTVALLISSTLYYLCLLLYPSLFNANLPRKFYHLAGQAAFVCLRYIGQENINGTLPGGTLVLAAKLHINFSKTFSSLFNLHRSAFYSEVLFCKFLVVCISSFPRFLEFRVLASVKVFISLIVFHFSGIHEQTK